MLEDIKLYKNNNTYVLGSLDRHNNLTGLCVLAEQYSPIYGVYSSGWGDEFELAEDSIIINQDMFKYRSELLYFMFLGEVYFVTFRYKQIAKSISNRFDIKVDTFKQIKISNE
jgi:hypothetical protein